MTSPIEKLFDGIEWEVVQEVEEEPDHNELPFVTHHGILRIGECELEVVQLSNGQRVLTKESLVNFFCGEKKGA